MRLFDLKTYKFSKFRIITFSCLFVVVLIVDQWTKSWARQNIKGDPRYFSDLDIGFVFATNSGSAFSLFSNSTIYISIIAIVVVIILLFAIFKTERNIVSMSYMFISVGALGNLIDRFTQPPYGGQGEVTDFIHIGWWPTFNIADSMITAGAVLLVLSAIFQGQKSDA